MRALAESVLEWTGAGERVAVATVVETRRSAPQPVGTKMAINGRGQVVGAVSGGCVEGAVVEIAERVLAGAPPQLVYYGMADEMAWDVGLPCGGEIGVWVEVHDPSGTARRFYDAAVAGGRAAIVTVLDGAESAGAKLFVPTHGEAEGTLGSADLDTEAVRQASEALWTESGGLVATATGATLFVDVVAPPARLIIVGAIDFAAQLAEVAKLAGWRPFVVDPRARFATAERFPAAEEVIVAWPDMAFAKLAPIDPATAIAVLTHDPKLDDAALAAALGSSAFYIGAMGSHLAQRRRRARLLEAGFDEAALERIAAPIGLDLGALTSAETALSIMSEIVALKHGRSGGRLIVAGGRIHDAAPDPAVPETQ
jgi:xanthine dehydrogenase accessory factor